jgi:hypothetical protein
VAIDPSVKVAGGAMMKEGTDDGSIAANLFESVPASGRFDF